VIGRGEVELHHRAQDAVVREPAAVDVVAEQDQLGLGLARIELPRLELGEEVGLEQRALRCGPPSPPNRPHFDADSTDSAIPSP